MTLIRISFGNWMLKKRGQGGGDVVLACLVGGGRVVHRAAKKSAPRGRVQTTY